MERASDRLLTQSGLGNSYRARSADATFRDSRITVCGLLLLMWLTGCRQFAQVTVVQPAPIDVSGIRRLTVVPFTGEQGAAIASSVTTQLWKNDFYALVDQAELNPIRTVSAVSQPDYESIRHAAREVNVDGIITGDVIEYRCDDQVLRESEFLVEDDEHSDEHHEHDRTTVGFRQSERVRREATVSIAFRLIDAETGAVRLSHQATKSYQNSLDSAESRSLTRGEVLDELTEQCVGEFIRQMAPHEEQREMRLARASAYSRGASRLRQGNRLASSGDWSGAKTEWESALQQNPNLHAARYNLALEAATRQAFDEAEEHAMQAIRTSHCDCYAAGLEQIREYRTAYSATISQHDERKQIEPDRSFR